VRHLFLLLVVLIAALPARAARADDQLAVGYLISRPVARSGTGAQHSLTAQYVRMLPRCVEIGGGIETGVSGGEEPLARVAFLAGVGLRLAQLGELRVRIEELGGWQIVRGRLTLDGIPLRGTETRSWHDELAITAEAPLSNVVQLRARAGITIDGVYPAGHASTRSGPFVGISFVIAIR
jgi:hypothetical protein